MGMPQETTNEVRTDENAGTVSANENAFKMVALPVAEEVVAIFESGLADLKILADLKTTSPASMVAAIDAFQGKTAGLKRQMVDTAIEAFKRPDEKVEITGAPNLILRRSGDYKPGEWVPEKSGAFVKTFTYDEFFGNRQRRRQVPADPALYCSARNTVTVHIPPQNKKSSAGLHLLRRMACAVLKRRRVPFRRPWSIF